MKHIGVLIFFCFIMFCGCDKVEEEKNHHDQPFFSSFSFTVDDNPSLEKDINVVFNKDTKDSLICLFIPHLITDSLVARFDGLYDNVFVKDVKQVSGYTKNNFNEFVDYLLTLSSGKNEIKKRYRFCITGYNGVPVVIINTESCSPIESLTEYVSADIRIINKPQTGILDTICDIRGRGNSTWGLEKKPYRIKFKEKLKLLGEDNANAKSWTLLANHSDKSLIRNALTSELGKFCGFVFNPAAVFVDLVMNGEYLGTYQISDQVEVSKYRIDVEKQDYQTTGDEISGGYLLEISDKRAIAREEGDKPWFSTDIKDIGVLIKYPEKESYNDSQIEYIRDYVNSFEDCLFNVAFDDSLNCYRQFIDINSLVNWYICTELSANLDGMYSTYVYKYRNDKRLFWGPLWDNDIAWNNCYRMGDFSAKLIREDGYGEKATKDWFIKMGQDFFFLSSVNVRWKQLVNSGIERYLMNKVDSLSSYLLYTQDANYKKWDVSKRNYDELVLYDSYVEYIMDIKEFIHNRILFLTNRFEEDVKAFDRRD